MRGELEVEDAVGDLLRRPEVGPRGRAAFDTLERRLATLVPGHPRLALRASDRLGRLRNRLSRRWPSPEQVLALFPELGLRRAAGVAWRIGGLEARNRAWVEGLRQGGLDPLRPLVRIPAAVAELRPPVLFGIFHAGAVHALSPALEQLPAPVIALRHGILYQGRPPLTVATTEGGGQERAKLFQRLLAHLQDGGFVATALDVVPGMGVQAPCLGHRITLARGPLGLARLAGVPIVPLVGRFRGGGVEIVFGEALSTPPETSDAAAWESALAASAAGWLERYLRAEPSEISLGLLRNLLGAQIDKPADGG
jgi:hypothetical protein